MSLNPQASALAMASQWVVEIRSTARTRIKGTVPSELEAWILEPDFQGTNH